MSEITPETSKRMCKHMNEDHGISVYAMLLSSIDGSPESSMKISNCKLKNVSMTKMDISYVACDLKNGTCMPRDTSIDFEPPLESAAEVRPRLVKLHHQNLAPKFSWIITDSICRTIILSVLALGYFDFMGLDAFSSDIENRAPEFFKDMIHFLFGSVESLFRGVQVSFKFAVLAHFLEACYAAYLCKNSLKMNLKGVLSWFCVVTMVGYPMTSKVLNFVKVQNQMKNEQKKK